MITLTCPLCGERTLDLWSKRSLYRPDCVICFNCYRTERGDEEWANRAAGKDTTITDEAFDRIQEAIQRGDTNTALSVFAITRLAPKASLLLLSKLIADNSDTDDQGYWILEGDDPDRTPPAHLQIASSSLNGDLTTSTALIDAMVDRYDAEEMSEAVHVLIKIAGAMASEEHEQTPQKQATSGLAIIAATVLGCLIGATVTAILLF